MREFSKSDIQKFTYAREASLKSDFGNIKIGCVIFNGGNKAPIATGYNKRKTHPRQKRLNTLRFDNDPTYDEDTCSHSIHAEIDALNKISNIPIHNASIYIYREYVKGGFGNCRPCLGCMKALYKHGIYHIYYTTNMGLAYEYINEVKL